MIDWKVAETLSASSRGIHDCSCDWVVAFKYLLTRAVGLMSLKPCEMYLPKFGLGVGAEKTVLAKAAMAKKVVDTRMLTD